jgi:hypothetical protein
MRGRVARCAGEWACQGSGCALKKAHISELAFSASLCGPSTPVIAGGIGYRDDHAIIVMAWTARAARRPVIEAGPTSRALMGA